MENRPELVVTLPIWLVRLEFEVGQDEDNRTFTKQVEDTFLEAFVAEGRDSPAVCLQVNTSNEPAKHGWSPEEILADNFVLLVNGKSPVPSPEILKQMRSLLTRR